MMPWIEAKLKRTIRHLINNYPNQARFVGYLIKDYNIFIVLRGVLNIFIAATRELNYRSISEENLSRDNYDHLVGPERIPIWAGLVGLISPF